MKFSPKCRTKKLGMIYTILRRFCSFFNWEGAVIRPQIRPRKIPESKRKNEIEKLQHANSNRFFSQPNIFCGHSKNRLNNL